MRTCKEIRNRIPDYVDGLLAPALMAKIEAHLDDCAGCREECEDLRSTIRLVSQWGRFHCPVDCTSYVLSRLDELPARGTRFKWPSLSLALRAGFAATAAAGAAAAIIAGLVFRTGAPATPVSPLPPIPTQLHPATASTQPALDPAAWHDASRTQQALGTTDSLVLEISGSGRSQ